MLYISRIVDPWINQAFEEWLFRCTNAPCLFLYRNSTCVVIGKNQIPWRDSNLRLLRKLNIPIVRRRSGGGSVFHDLGNTNYYSLMPRTAFDRHKTASIVADSLLNLGIIEANYSPRGDVLIKDLKVGGSAYKIAQNNAYHHGTMLISTDIHNLSQKLTTNKLIQSRAILSVPAKVTRLVDHRNNISHEDFCMSLCESYSNAHSLPPDLLSRAIYLTMDDFLANPRIQEYYNESKTDEWTYQYTPTFIHIISSIFEFGKLELQFTVSGGKYASFLVNTDNLEIKKDIEKMLKDIIGIAYDDGNPATIEDLYKIRARNMVENNVLQWIINETIS